MNILRAFIALPRVNIRQEFLYQTLTKEYYFMVLGIIIRRLNRCFGLNG